MQLPIAAFFTRWKDEPGSKFIFFMRYLEIQVVILFGLILGSRWYVLYIERLIRYSRKASLDSSSRGGIVNVKQTIRVHSSVGT